MSRMHSRNFPFGLALGCLLFVACSGFRLENRIPPEGTPRLLVFIVVDQARADYLPRFAPYFSGGISQLLAESVNFTSTSHDHAITKTAPGHATLVSGVHPARHGIIGNGWYDRQAGAAVKADEDMAFTPERAPTRLRSTTLGDWLKAAYPQSKVFAASIKSRAAVTSGGHAADAAFWYEDETGLFVSSDYYPRAAPQWLESFHGDRLPDRLFGTPWVPLETTTAATEELGLRQVNRGILRGMLPRPVGGAKTVPNESYYSDFRNESPFPDRYLGELALAILENERLGMDEYPDILALSFSSLDYIGHRYGPNSPEVLDTLLRLDETLGKLLEYLERHVGLEHVIVSLTSDHGAPEIPEYANGRRFWVEERGCLQRASKALDASFGAAKWLQADLVFDRDVLAAHGVDLEQAVSVLAEAVTACPGIDKVWTAATLSTSRPEGRAGRLYGHSFHPELSPDLLIQNEAGSIVTHNETDHGSPYDYDRRVPWLLRLPSAMPVSVSAEVSTVDVAPTLAEILDLPRPPGLDGQSRLPLLGAPETALDSHTESAQE